MKYVVKKGDYLAKVAAAHGLDAATVWNDPANAALRAKRDPNVLNPGDLITLPDGPPQPATLALQEENAFVAELPSVDVVLALEQDGKRLANEPYLVQGLPSQEMRTTDENGVARFTADVSVTRVNLLLPKRGLRFEVRIGYLDPASAVSGLRARLRNLGYHADSAAALLEALGGERRIAADAHDAARLEAAIAALQKNESLPVTGRSDASTIAALMRAHGG